MVFTRRRSSRLAAAKQYRQSPEDGEQTVEDAVTDTAEKLSTLAEGRDFEAAKENECGATANEFGNAKSTPSKGVLSLFSAIAQRTPKDRSGIQRTGDEMHPQQHHKSTTTPYDEARWLGFFNMDAHSATAKSTPVAMAAPASPTPSKPTTTVTTTTRLCSPHPDLTFKRQSSVELSPEAKQMMQESREEAARLRARMSALPTIPDVDPSASLDDQVVDVPERKIAKPKGKVGRFSAAHMAEFKKMDSIEKHPSTWRLDASRPPAATKSLKRSPSKAELDKPEANPFVHKPTSTATVGLHGIASPAKRIKQALPDDTAKTPPTSYHNRAASISHLKTASSAKSGIPRPTISHLMTPTKASIARSQSVKSIRTTKLPLPSLSRSRSVKTLRNPHTPSKQLSSPAPKPSSPSPVKVIKVPENDPGKDLMEPPKSPTPNMNSFGSVIPKIKSILRTPQRLYSDDPSLIAAGTHLATPPELRRRLLHGQNTGTISKQKHVDFTASANEKAARDELKAASVEPDNTGYPKLPANLEEDDSRRSTISSLPIPGSFTFRAGTPIVFASDNTPPRRSTIRAVRSSDIGLQPASSEQAVPSAKPQRIGGPSPFSKRKLEFLDQTYANPEAESEKENCDDEELNDRPAKKMRTIAATFPTSPSKGLLPNKSTPRKLTKKSKPPGSASKRVGGISAARLNILARPKHHT